MGEWHDRSWHAGGGYSSAEDINDAGQVVGYSTTGSGVTHGFRWDKGVMTDLGSLGGDVSDAMGINPAGQVVGTSYTPIPPISGGHPRAYLWQAGVRPTGNARQMHALPRTSMIRDR